MSVIEEIAAERRRQIAKGYDATHDDAHADREILTAGGWGVIARVNNAAVKGKDPYRARELLVEAAAMIMAEIERLDRKSKADATG